MAKRYTALDMRLVAEDLTLEGLNWMSDRGTLADAADMLRQAAEMIEREKKYEYTAEYIKRRSGKVASQCVFHFNSFHEAKRFKYYPLKNEKLRFIRREVGQWEEVK